MSDVKLKLLQYEIDFFQISTSQYVGGEVSNGYTFINYGTTSVKIEAVTLQPSQQLEVAGNVGEITNQRFFVNFGGVSSGNNCVIIKKRYLNV
jgi:ATP-dependent Lon protease